MLVPCLIKFGRSGRPILKSYDTIRRCIISKDLFYNRGSDDFDDMARHCAKLMSKDFDMRPLIKDVSKFEESCVCLYVNEFEYKVYTSKDVYLPSGSCSKIDYLGLEGDLFGWLIPVGLARTEMYGEPTTRLRPGIAYSCNGVVYTDGNDVVVDGNVDYTKYRLSYAPMCKDSSLYYQIGDKYYNKMGELVKI